ncbi:pseudouridine synthase [Lignipirellula cremea]|uniref:Pseudouridine synthase n=1 Tax=Lignipirellula cremea TaxID=2528010 RepID=A0A518E0K6_9BACT|nr:pseudouridine synthase [Lignipirellula cremea]QDU97613.1 Ribosomal large subunit pseudouridine synthase B [Lignipirellula cremea]
MAGSSQSKSSSSPGAERLQKVLAAAGVGSRRECEQLIVDGRVEVDRVIVDQLGTKVDADKQLIRVDGEPVKITRRQYHMVNKPSGVVSTNRDPDGRTRVIDLVNIEQRLFTVGRLDKSSEGLILVTNDGELANQLAHPRHGIEKTYYVRVVGNPTVEDLNLLLKGVHLAEGVAKVSRIKVRKKFKECADLEVVLNEGRNREIRRLLAKIGHKVVRLQRVALGPLKLGLLPAGATRRLTNEEVEALERAVSRKVVKKPSSNSEAISADGLEAARSAAAMKKPARSDKRSSAAGERSGAPGKRSSSASRPGKPGGRPGKPGARSGKASAAPSRPATGRGAGSQRAAKKAASRQAPQPRIGAILDYDGPSNDGGDASQAGFDASGRKKRAAKSSARPASGARKKSASSRGAAPKTRRPKKRK